MPEQQAEPVDTSVPPVAPAPVEEEHPEETVDNGNNAAINKFVAQKEMLKERFNALPSGKRNIIVAAGIFVVGLLMGAILFGGSSDEPVVQAPRGLQGVVLNPDIKENEQLKRCGQVDPSSPCVLYIMNSYTYDKMAKDFFETAVAVTRRKDLVIQMDNVRYAQMRIPPGYFAQIKIPAYK